MQVLFGQKCAEGIRDRVLSITVCDLAEHVLSSILDAECTTMIQEYLETNGIQFLLEDTVTLFKQNVVHMKSGKTVDFDVLILAVGVSTNTS